jgi:hypothetical protein
VIRRTNNIVGKRIMDNNKQNNDPQNTTQKRLGMIEEDGIMTHGTYPGHERGGRDYDTRNISVIVCIIDMP